MGWIKISQCIHGIYLIASINDCFVLFVLTRLSTEAYSLKGNSGQEVDDCDLIELPLFR